jgi:hypothetical protein
MIGGGNKSPQTTSGKQQRPQDVEHLRSEEGKRWPALSGFHKLAKAGFKADADKSKGKPPSPYLSEKDASPCDDLRWKAKRK